MLDAQGAVEITRHHHDIFIELNHSVDAGGTRKHCHGSAEDNRSDMHFAPHEIRRHRGQRHDAELQLVI